MDKRSELDEGPDMSGARAARQSYRLCKQAALFAQAVLFTIPRPVSRRGIRGQSFLSRSPPCFPY